MNFRLISFCRRMARNATPEQLLFVCWIAGSSLGFYAARFLGDAFASFLLSLPGQIPDWGGILVSAVMPLFLSAIAVFMFQAMGCFLSCLFRGFGQGAAVCLIGMGFGSGAPLMTVLLLFSSWLINPILLLYWMRYLGRDSGSHFVDTLWSAVLCFLIGAVDHSLIAPFLADVINISR